MFLSWTKRIEKLIFALVFSLYRNLIWKNLPVKSQLQPYFWISLKFISLGLKLPIKAILIIFIIVENEVQSRSKQEGRHDKKNPPPFFGGGKWEKLEVVHISLFYSFQECSISSCTSTLIDDIVYRDSSRPYF